MGWFIIFGTVPIGLFGLVLKDQIESSARALLLVGSALVVFSLVMLAAELVAAKRRKLSETNLTDGLVVGIAQALALIPGVSRSGATISAGLFRGFDRSSAARYSFLLSVPAVVLSGLFELPEIGGGTGASVAATVIAGLVAFASGYGAIAWLLRYLSRHSLNVFVAYRIPLGVLVIVLAATGLIS